MKLTDEQKEKICDLIEKSLLKATLNGVRIDDGGAYPLVDWLTTKNEDSIQEGIEEIQNIVEQIYFDMDDWEV